MLYTDDLCEDDHILNYDIFIPQGKWSKVHVHLWAEHFNRPLKTRNNALSRAFEKEHFRHRVLYPFLDESQILGKTFSKFYIPNICGKISKNFLQKYTSSKRYQKKIGNFDLKTPYLVLREEHLPKTTKGAFNIPVKTIGEVKNKQSNPDSSFEHSYDFYEDKTTAKISDTHAHLEITNKYKKKNVSNNSVQNNVNKGNVIPNNTNDFRKRSIMNEKDDQILKEQFLLHDGSVFVENKTTKFNDEFGNLNSSLSQLNTKPNIKKCVRFNDTKLCTYESSHDFNTDSSQNSTVPTETELLFDLFVKRGKQTQKKDANYVSDNIEKLSEKSSDDLSLNISKEKYSNGKQNQTSLDSWEMEIDSTTTNTSTVDFILPTPEENNKSTSEFGKKYACESINILNQIEECDRKNTSIEIHSHASSFKMNTLNSSTDKYMTNTTSDYNCNLESICDIRQQMQIDETGHFVYINNLEKADCIDKMNTSNVKIPVIISESDTNASTINFISPTPETNNQNKNELCQKPTYKIMGCDKLDQDTDETGKFVDENKLKDIRQLNQIKSNAKVSLVINESELSNHETNAIPVETKEKEQANDFPESHLEYSSDSSGRIYEDDMYSQDFTNATSVEIPQKELDMDVLEDSWEQSNNNRNIVCSSVDDNDKLSCRIVGNNTYFTGDKICSGQPVSPSDNAIIINESRETGSNEIFESQNDRLEAIKLDECGSHNYLTPATNKHNDNQITKAPKKDNTWNMCDNNSPVRTVKILEQEEYKTDSGKDMNCNEQISTKMRKKLFSLPSKSESSMHSADITTDTETQLYCGDILLDSQMLSVKLNSLCKQAIMTCTINYKTDKLFDKENEAKSITGRNNNDDNKIKESNLNITSEDLEGTKLTNKNILHDTYSNDVDTLFQQNKKNKKLLSNYVSENTIQSCDTLVTCTSSPEDSSDYIITPDIEMPLKRKKWKVQQNLNSETLSSSTQKNEGCFIYNKKETEGNCVILQQPNLSTQDQKINFLHTEVSRQSLQNIDKENSNVYSRAAGSNEINISTTTEDSVINLDEMVNDRDSQLMSNYEELSKQSICKTKLASKEIKRRNAVIASELLISGITSQTEENVDGMIQIHRHVLESEPLITNKTREYKEDNGGTSSQTNFCAESNIKLRQKLQGIKKQNVNVSTHLVTNIRQSLDNINDTEQHEDLIEQTDSTNLSREDIQRIKQLNVVTSKPLVIKQSMDNIEGGNNRKDFLDKTSTILTRQDIQRKKQQGIISSDPLVTDIVRQTVDSIEDTYNQEDFIEQTESTNLSRQEIKRKKHLGMVTKEPLITNANNIKQSMDNNKGGNNHKDFLDKTSTILTRKEIQRKKQQGVISSDPLVTDIVRQTVDSIEETYNQEDFIEQTDSTNLSRQEIKRKKHLSMVTKEPLITNANNIKQSMDNNEGGNNHKDFLDKTSTILTRKNIQRKKQQGIISSEPLVTGIVRQTVDSIEDTYNQEDFIKQTDSTNLSRQEIKRKKHLSMVTTEPLITDANNIKQSMDNNEGGNNHNDFLGKTSTILTRQNIQRKKQQGIISSGPLVTDIVRQTVDSIEDTYNQEDVIEQTDSTNLSRQEIKRKKHLSMVTTEPLITDANNIKQSMDNNEGGNNHKDFLDKTSTILTRKEIQRKKQQEVISSDPLVTDIVRQTVDSIENTYNQEDFIEQTDSTNLSRQEIKRKKHLSMVTTEPLITDANNIKQSMDNNEGGNNHKDFLDQAATILTRQNIQRKKQQRIFSSEPLVTDIVRQTVDSIEDTYNQEDLIEQTDSTNLSRQEIKRKKHLSMVTTEPLITDANNIKQSMDNNEGGNNHKDFLDKTSTILTRQNIQRKKQQEVISSDPLVTDIVRQTVDSIEDTYNQEDFIEQTDSTNLSRQEIKRKKHLSMVTTEPLITDANNIKQSMDNNEGGNNHKDFLDKTSTILTRKEIQRKKQQEVISSDPLVTDIVRQTVDSIEDTYNQEDFIEQTDSTNLSRQEIKSKKHLSIVPTEPLTTNANNIKQSMDNNEGGNNHKDFLDKKSKILTRQEIQRKKQQGVISSDPLVTDIVRQTVDSIENTYNQEDFIEQIDSTNLSRQEIKSKKHLSMVTTEPLITGANNIKQSMDNNEGRNNHKDFLDKTSTILTRQEIQRKKQQGVISSVPLVTDIVRQSVDNTEDIYNEEDIFKQADSTNSSRHNIQKEKHRKVVTSELIVTCANNVKQSDDNVKDTNKHKDFFDKTAKILTRQDTQRKNQHVVFTSEPLVTNIVKQSEDSIRDMYSEENFLEQTNSKNISRQDFQKKKHLNVVKSRPLVTIANSVTQSVDNIEDANNHKDFPDKRSMILSRQDIQWKKQRSVVSSEPLVTNIVSQSMDNTNAFYNQEGFVKESDSSTLSRQKRKFHSIVLSEPLVTNIVKQSVDNFKDDHEDFISQTDSVTHEFQQLQYKDMLISDPIINNVSKQSFHNIDNIHSNDDFSRFTNSAISSRKEIQSKKQRTMLSSEPLIADDGSQSMNEAIDYHDSFRQLNSTSLSRHEFKKKKPKSVIRSEPVINHISLPSLNNFQYSPSHDTFHRQSDFTSLSRQEIPRKKFKRVLKSKTMVTDNNNLIMDNTNDFTTLSRHEMNRKYQEEVMPETLNTKKQLLVNREVSNDLVDDLENCEIISLSKQKSSKNKSYNVKPKELGTDSRQSNICFEDTFDDKPDLTIPSLCKNLQLTSTNSDLPIKSKFMIDNLPCNTVVSQVSNDSYSGQILNMEETFLNNERRQRHLIHQTKLKSRNPLLSNISSCRIVKKKYTPMVQENENLPFTSIITSYSNSHDESNSEATSPLQTMHGTLTKHSHIHHYSQTTSQRRSSATGAEEYLSIQNSNENQLLSTGASLNEWDCNLLSEEDLKGTSDSQKICTASSENYSVDGRITNTVWSDSNSKSSAGSGYGFDFDLPSYDENSCSENTSLSNSIVTDNVSTDDPWLDI